jgi:hypothetical protein
MIDRELLRKQIPYGYIIKIAAKAMVTRKSVNDYFSGKTNSQKVEKAALEVAAELANEKRSLLNQIQ